MRVMVGYSDNPDTSTAGEQAARAVTSSSGAACDLVLLFSTVRHDPFILQKSISAVIGENVPIYGGGTIGVISADHFGYAGDQLVLAAIWLEGTSYEAVVEPMDDGEAAAGARIGKRLRELRVQQDSSLLLFYDALDINIGKPARMFMATPLLSGIEAGLGFLPDLAGAGLMSDYVNISSFQWTGSKVEKHVAIVLYFSSNLRLDMVIMHGCYPSTDYYTVTKADGQMIQEINHEPAISFVHRVLGTAIPPENYPFFLIFGINQGDKWGEFDEENYASRLCLAIDEAHGGIVMFEPDMVEGTEFQIMYRSMDFDYMPQRVDRLFQSLNKRKPVLAMYINCAGRAGYGSTEDALVVQQAVQGKVPLIGIYSGVEIAPVNGVSRGLDWTGVFCLFSCEG